MQAAQTQVPEGVVESDAAEPMVITIYDEATRITLEQWANWTVWNRDPAFKRAAHNTAAVRESDSG